MTKKFITALCICLVAMGCVFADGIRDKIEVQARVSPYGMEILFSEGDKLVSSYGYGFGLGARYEITDNISAGLDIDTGIYKIRGFETAFVVAGARAVGGYRYDFTDEIYGEGEIGLGANMKIYGEKRLFAFSAHAYAGAGYRITDNLRATAGLDFGFGLQKLEGVKLFDQEIKVQAGAVIEL